MKKLFLFLSLFTGATCQAQTADDIINKHFALSGGAEKWSKINSITYTGVYIMGPGMQAPITSTDIIKPYRGSTFSFSWQGMTSMQAIRADSGWSYNPFGGKRETDPLTPEDIRSNRLGSDPQSLLLNYKEKGYTVEYLGTDDMDGTDVFKLRLTNKEGDIVYYFIDTETYYILKEIQRVKLKDKEIKQSFSFSDFKKTDFGIIIPFSQQRVDDEGNEQGGPTNMSKIEVNATVDTKLFDKPKL